MDKEQIESIAQQLNQRANLLKRVLDNSITILQDEGSVLFYLRNASDYLDGLMRELRAAHIYVQDQME